MVEEDVARDEKLKEEIVIGENSGLTNGQCVNVSVCGTGRTFSLAKLLDDAFL